MELPAANAADARVVAFQRATACFGLLLIVASWPLWRGVSTFPQIPLFAWGVACPRWVDLILVIFLMSCLVGLLTPVSKNWRMLLNVGAAGMWLLLFALNQHRLQPWAYQMFLLALVFSVANARTTIHLARALAATVYIYSAIGKFDEAFYSQTGAEFLNEGLRWVTRLPRWPEAIESAVVRAMPLGELAVGLGLATSTVGLWRRRHESVPRWLKLTCAASVLGALMMHVFLLAVLGTWGLGHHWGVLIWNLFFMVQAVILFAKPEVPHKVTSSGFLPVRLIMYGVITAALVMPLGAKFGRWDHWLSWGLYSPGNGVVQVFIHPSAVNKLPKRIGAHVVDTSDPNYQRLDLNQWSLAELRVPVYPSDRFQAGIALAVAKLPSLDRRVSAGWSPPSIGKRTYKTFSPTQLPRLTDEFIFNAQPRE